jgi:hypothetical protein
LSATFERLTRRLEGFLLPRVDDREQAALTAAQHATDFAGHDFSRVVTVVAVAAVGFFVPALVIANVPMALWLPYLGAAVVAGIGIGGSFVVIRPGSRLAMPSAALNVCLVAALAVIYEGYFHQLPMLFALVVAAYAVVHGIGPALVSSLIGAVLVPLVAQSGVRPNPTDFVYAFIYLFGTGLLPWTAGRLARRRAVALSAQLDQTQAAEREAVFVLARAAEAKDHVTGEHVKEVADLAERLALRVGYGTQAAADLRFAAMLHDVGKLHLPDRVLQKPGPLTPDEWELVKQHTVWGEKILGSTDGFELARRVARSHHENFDGSGYPDGLHGTGIPLDARIVRLVDVLDAMRQERPYKPAWPLERCLEEIARGAGTQFDPELAMELLRMVEPSAALLPQLAPAPLIVPAPPLLKPPPVSPVQALDGILPALGQRSARRARRLDRVAVSR